MQTLKMAALLSFIAWTTSTTVRAQGPGRRPDQSPGGQRLSNRQPGGFPKYDLVMLKLSRTGNVISMTIRNQGPLATPASQVYVQALEVRTGRTLQSKFARVSPLQPNKSMQIRMHNFGEVRYAKIYATVDPYNKLQEANEGNNSRVINVGDASVGGPDLALSFIQARVNSGRIVVRAKNVGKGKLQQRIPIRLTTAFGLKQHERLFSTISGLNPGQSVDVVFRPKQKLLVGMTIEAKIDPSNAVPEASEANNARTASYPTR